MKRYIVIILAMMAVFCLAACGGTSELNKEDGKIKIVATIFPEYDWVKTVMGDMSAVSLMSGLRMHLQLRRIRIYV